jgi:hypothetical protein
MDEGLASQENSPRNDWASVIQWNPFHVTKTPGITWSIFKKNSNNGRKLFKRVMMRLQEKTMENKQNPSRNTSFIWGSKISGQRGQESCATKWYFCDVDRDKAHTAPKWWFGSAEQRKYAEKISFPEVVDYLNLQIIAICHSPRGKNHTACARKENDSQAIMGTPVGTVRWNCG